MGDEPRRSPGPEAATKPDTQPKQQHSAPAPAATVVAENAPAAWSWDADRIASVGAALYLAAAAVVLGRWLLGWAALRRLLRRCEPVAGRAADPVRGDGGAGAPAAPAGVALDAGAVQLWADAAHGRAAGRVVRGARRGAALGVRPRAGTLAAARTPGRDCCSAWRRRSTSPCRGSGRCAARPGCARSTWPTRPPLPPAAAPKTMPNSCWPGRPRPDRRFGRAASGGDLLIFFGG